MVSEHEPRLKLVVDQGPCAGAELVLTDGTLAIGRDPRAHLALTGDETVSKQHAEITSTADGTLLRNLSPNGTMINGRPVMDAQLAAGDSISVGLVHLVSVRVYVRPPPPPPPIRKPATAYSAAASTPGWDPKPDETTEPVRSGKRVPVWIMVYLGLVGLAFIGFGVMKVRDTGPPGLMQIQAQEQQYAAARKLTKTDTDRVMRLLETATVHERRGDSRSAYEAYRETLGVRIPVEPLSPAYRYAASRIAQLGPK